MLAESYILERILTRLDGYPKRRKLEDPSLQALATGDELEKYLYPKVLIESLTIMWEPKQTVKSLKQTYLLLTYSYTRSRDLGYLQNFEPPQRINRGLLSQESCAP